MLNTCLDPLYIFRKTPTDILLHIRTFIKHHISEITNIRSNMIQQSILNKLEKHKENIENGFCENKSNYILSPDEERFWQTYVLNIINQKITDVKLYHNIETILIYLQNNKENNGIISYNWMRYYLSELETLFKNI